MLSVVQYMDNGYFILSWEYNPSSTLGKECMLKNWDINTPLEFQATENFYLIKGIKYTRVTRILSIIDKPELRNWYADTGRVKAREILKKRATFGSTLHKLIEVSLSGEKITKENYDKSIIETFNLFENWKNKNNIIIEAVEQHLWSDKYKYAGTCDCIAIINGKRVLCDWKTSKGIYPEYVLQIAAYFHAFKELTNIELDGAIILQMRDNKYCEKYYTKEELKEAFKIFLHAKEIFEWKHKSDD